MWGRGAASSAGKSGARGGRRAQSCEAGARRAPQPGALSTVGAELRPRGSAAPGAADAASPLPAAAAAARAR